MPAALLPVPPTPTSPEPAEDGAPVDDAVVVVGDDGRVLFHNPAFTALWQLPRASCVGDDYWELAQEAALRCAVPDAFLASVARHRDSAGEFRAEVELRDGRVVERTSSSASRGDGGAVRVVLFRDLTARRRADAALQARLREERAVARVSRLAIEATDPDALLEEASRAVADALGCAGGAFVRGADGLRFAAPGGAAVDARAEALDVVANVVEAALERLATERRLRDRERLFAAVFDGTVDGMVILDGDGRYLEVNRAALDLFRANASDVVGRRLGDVLPHAARLPPLDAPSPDIPDRGNLAVPLPDGRVRHFEYATARHILPGRHLGIVRDVTDRAEAQARIALADRLVSVGTLAAGVAHELNNPLAACASNAAFLEGALAALAAEAPGAAPARAAWDAFHETAREALVDLRSGLERLRHTVGDMQAFAHGTEQRRGPIDVREAVRTALSLTNHAVARRASVVTALEDVPPVVGGEGLLAQVLVNLLLNAADAIPAGADPAAHRITVGTGRAPDGRVWMAVSDTGGGMAQDVASRAFDPFFTTKPAGAGPGLGLPIAQAIVSRHGGEIRLESRPGEGTTVRVLLPAA